MKPLGFNNNDSDADPPADLSSLLLCPTAEVLNVSQNGQVSFPFLISTSESPGYYVLRCRRDFKHFVALLKGAKTPSWKTYFTPSDADLNWDHPTTKSDKF